MGYFQTWPYVFDLRRNWPRLVRAIQFMCGLFGHEISQTEWSYWGGPCCDVRCRWCDKLMQMPMVEARRKFPSIEGMGDSIRAGIRNSIDVFAEERKREKINEIPAGRELDALVAKKVMELNIVGDECPSWVPRYSTDMDAAWGIVNKTKLIDKGFDKITCLYRDSNTGNWCVGIPEPFCNGVVMNPLGHGWADTAPLAICRAAIRVGDELGVSENGPANSAE